MKIAIMFSGEFRWFESFKRSFQENFKPVLEGHSVQYFAYFWNKNRENMPDFMALCNPLVLEIENEKSISEIQNFFGYTRIINSTMPFQAYTAHRAALLLNQYQQQYNTVFDLYIRMRPDLFFPNKINLDEFDATSIYTKQCHSGTSPLTYLCDYAYFTKSYEVVQKMAEWGRGFDDALNDPRPLIFSQFAANNDYCPEEMLARYASNRGLTCKLHSFDLDLARHH